MSSNHSLVSRLTVLLFLVPGLASLLLVTPVADELGFIGEARGEESGTPDWTYSLGNILRSVDISKDGETIVVASDDNYVYLFDKDNSTPLWSYETGDDVHRVAISADGNYIAAASEDRNVYLFNRNSSTPIWQAIECLQ